MSRLPEGFHIRKAEKADAAAIISYLNRVGGESDNLLFGENEFHMTVEAEERFIESLREARASALFVGLVGEEIACAGSFISSPRERIAHVADTAVSVARKYWGLGIGSALMERLIAFGRENGQTELMKLTVRAGNEGGLALYRKFGYQEVGRYPRSIKIRGSYHDEIIMALPL